MNAKENIIQSLSSDWNRKVTSGPFSVTPPHLMESWMKAIARNQGHNYLHMKDTWEEVAMVAKSVLDESLNWRPGPLGFGAGTIPSNNPIFRKLQHRRESC